ncbi:MAG: galactose-1-phosphate uridylyltransferase [Patescibacteria group bacterium]
MESDNKKIQLSKSKFPSELRYDLVSKDWVVIATGRAKRPEMFKKERKAKESVPKSQCPFCNLGAKEKPILIFDRGKKIVSKGGLPRDWTTVVIPNKYPAFSKSDSFNERAEGPYHIIDGVGFHEVVVTRDHEKQMAQFSVDQIKEVVNVYQERYLDLMNEKFVSYISIFHNNGKEAGASVSHPHSQIIALPFIDPDLQSSINGSAAHFKRYGQCVHCDMLAYDKKDGRRIVFENEEFIVLVPFASRVAFETRIYPKVHHAYFERITHGQKDYFAEAFKAALSKIYKALNDPAYNFFIHTAPCDGKDYNHYHWHLEILPKTSIWAGFELGVGIEISTIEPETAAEYLRKQ